MYCDRSRHFLCRVGQGVKVDQSGFALFEGLRVDVVGLGVAGFACADSLMQRESIVTLLDASDAQPQAEKAKLLGILGATSRIGQPPSLSDDAELLIVSPGVQPADPIVLEAKERGVPIWGELELAWHLQRGLEGPDWLFVTGTNGKTTTTLMLESILKAEGLKTAAVGNIGVSLVETINSGETFDVLAIEVGAPQMPFVYSPAPLAVACLNVAPDHIDHFGSMDAYIAAKARAFQNTRVACVYNEADPITLEMVEDAEVTEGARAVAFTSGIPAVSMLGVVDEYLVDRAFIPERVRAAQELGLVSDVIPAAPHNIENALAAAALARAAGVSPYAVGQGLRTFTPAPHRIAHVGTVGGVDYVDDSKATNCHAAQRSLSSFESVVWIAGGLAKGQDFDELVQSESSRIRAAVLIGRDREVIRQALSRHAPQVPIFEVDSTETKAMAEAVQLASRFAISGDTVLLAPGCASWDMFRNYSHRGEVFQEAVESLAKDG